MKYIILLLLFPSIAYGICRNSYVCDGNGECGYRDVCTDSQDLPSTNVRPIPALPTLELNPLPSLEFPPLGTTQCKYMQVNGRWENVCY